MGRAAISIARRVDSRILLLRGRRVILDSDLAELYAVPAKRLNQQVTRNALRFPADFRFRLSRTEYANLRLQFATSSLGHGGRRYLPYVFTEHGAVMAATVLNSERAIQVSIFVVRVFVHMRDYSAIACQIHDNNRKAERDGALNRREPSLTVPINPEINPSSASQKPIK